jgi:hypothetical protein
LLERVPVFVEIAQGLIPSLERCLEPARLTNRADRHNEGNSLFFTSLGLACGPDIPGHGSVFSVERASNQHLGYSVRQQTCDPMTKAEFER